MPWVLLYAAKERGLKEQETTLKLGLDVSSNLPTNHMNPVKTACRLGLDVILLEPCFNWKTPPAS